MENQKCTPNRFHRLTYLLDFHGVIFEAEDFDKLDYEAYWLIHKFKCPNLVLQVNPTCSVWFEDAYDDNTTKRIDAKYKKDHQMILFKTGKNAI